VILWAIYRSGGDRDLGAAVAAQMREVCERLPVPSLGRPWLDTGSSKPDPKERGAMKQNCRSVVVS
jgi:hypothetical protein